MSHTTTTACIDVCNSLLRGEISAIETYVSVIEKYRSEPQTSTLENIRDEHVDSANDLRAHIKGMGGEPERASGAWGTFAKTFQGTANFFGENSALQSLIEGEEHGVKEYKDGLENGHVMAASKTIYRDKLLPRLSRHIALLKALKKS